MYLSGGAGNSSPAASLGGIISSTEVTNNSLNDLWDDVSGTEATAGSTEYRCVYLKNTHATLSLTLSKAWIDTNTTASGDAITIGLDLAGVNATADTISVETEAPSPSVTFSTAVDKASGLNTGTVANGQYYGIWIKRVVNAGAGAATSNSYILKWEGDTAA